jgi:tetratricopeptide (TPR) repeat protein
MRGTARAILFCISVALFTMHGQMAMAQSDDVALCTQAGTDAPVIAACRRVLQSDASAQDKSRAHNRIGLSLGKTEIDKAIDHYKQALALNPNNVAPCSTLA